MDPVIIAALITAAAVIVAAIIGRPQPLKLDQVLFFCLWLLASIIPTTIWWVLIDQIVSLGLEFPMASFLAGIISGIVAGILQWLVLVNRWGISPKWILAVSLGWSVGGGIISYLTLGLFVNYILAGLVSGILGWLILNKDFDNAGWWVFAVIFDWLIAYWTGNYQGWSFDPTSGAIVGLFSALPTGFAFFFILKQKPK